MGGSPDGLLYDTLTGEWSILEIKTRDASLPFRDYIPITHICQMIGLAQAFQLTTCYYVCWTPDVGIYMARMTFDPAVWTDVIKPRLTEFCDYFDRKEVPPPMKRGEKDQVIAEIESRVYIEPVSTHDGEVHDSAEGSEPE